MSALPLTAEQEAEAEALCARYKSVFEQEAWQMARWLACTEDRQLLGGTECAGRERVHRLGAQGVGSVLQERKKRLPGDEGRGSALCGSGPGCERARQGAGEFAGAGAAGAGRCPRCGMWARQLSVGWGVRGNGDDAESGGGGSGGYRWGADELCRGQWEGTAPAGGGALGGIDGGAEPGGG